jgi:hypothetical protein
METLQNKILTLCSAIILICLSIMVLSCKKLGQPVKHAKYILINQTQHDIFIPEFLANNLVANKSLEKSITTDAGNYNETPKSYFSLFGDNDAIKGLGLKFIVKFNGNKCWQPPYEGDHSPLDINSYVAEKIRDNSYKFTYTFTEADYNRAVICP